MSLQTRTVAVNVGLSLFVMLLAGCGSDAPNQEGTHTEATPVVAATLVSLSPREQGRLPSVLAERRGTSFSRSAVVKDNARIFLWLAETEADPEVAAAALHALPTTWTHTPRYAAQMELLTPEYARVVTLRLADDRPTVQAAAMQAATKCLLGDTPDSGVLNELVRLATQHATAAGRYEALEVLWNSATIREHPEQMTPFVLALDAPEPWVVSGALFRLAGFGGAHPDQPALRAKLIQLLVHADPGVRGRAATTLSNMVGATDVNRDAVALAIVPLLADAHAFPRSAAATALAWLDYRPGVHALVPLLDDHAVNTYDLRGYTRLDGTPGFSHHDGSPWSRVDDAIIRAMQSFSSRVGTRFTFDIQQDRLDETFAVASQSARTWYRSVRAELPAAVAPAAP